MGRITRQDLFRENIGLSRGRLLPAVRCVTHDCVLWCCEALVNSGVLSRAFNIVHVDAHDDIVKTTGMGCFMSRLVSGPLDPSLLSCQVLEKYEPRCISEGNHLGWMLVMGMLSSITMVLHGDYDDFPSSFIDLHDGLIGVPVATEANSELSDGLYGKVFSDYSTSVEPSNCPYFLALNNGSKRLGNIHFGRCSEHDVFDMKPFDIAFISESPAYTPESSDSLFDSVYPDYFDFDRGMSLVKGVLEEISEPCHLSVRNQKVCVMKNREVNHYGQREELFSCKTCLKIVELLELDLSQFGGKSCSSV